MTIGILSWKARETLINTLESYKRFGLNDEEKIIYFQEIEEEDKEIARRYGYRYLGNDKNIGIAGGFSELVQSATGEFFLFLENDWQLIEYPWLQLNASKALIKNQEASLVRLRHRAIPGAPLWSRQFKGDELNHKEYILESVHWTEPGVDFPDYVKLKNVQLDYGIGIFLDQYFSITTSQYANWTNNPYIAETRWLQDYILPRVSGDIERDLQYWWSGQYFAVAHAQGLFTHNRIDR